MDVKFQVSETFSDIWKENQPQDKRVLMLQEQLGILLASYGFTPCEVLVDASLFSSRGYLCIIGGFEDEY